MPRQNARRQSKDSQEEPTQRKDHEQAESSKDIELPPSIFSIPALQHTIGNRAAQRLLSETSTPGPSTRNRNLRQQGEDSQTNQTDNTDAMSTSDVQGASYIQRQGQGVGDAASFEDKLKFFEGQQSGGESGSESSTQEAAADTEADEDSRWDAVYAIRDAIRDAHYEDESIYEGLTALEEKGTPAFATLKWALQEEPDMFVADLEIMAIEGGALLPIVANVFQSENSHAKITVIYGLEQVPGSQEAIQVLKLAMQDEDSYVRERALDALKTIGAGQSDRDIWWSLDEDGEEMSSEERDAAFRERKKENSLLGEAAAPEIATLVEDPDRMYDIIDSLVDIGEGAVPTLYKLTQHDNKDIAELAQSALRRVVCG